MQNTRSSKKQLIENIFFNYIYQFICIIVPLLTTPYVSRVLKPSGNGIYSFTVSIVSYFVIFAALGTSSYGMREIARNRENKVAYSKAFWEIELITVFSSLICLGLYSLVIINYIEYQQVFLILGLNIVAVIFDINWLYAGLEKNRYSVIINALIKVISVILIFTLVKNENDLNLYVIIQSGSLLLGNLSMWVFLPKVLTKASITFKNLSIHFKNTLFYFIPAIATSIYTILDKSLIGFITHSEEDNGFYEQSSKIIGLIKTISIFSLCNILSSRMSYLYGKEDENGIKNTFEKTINIVSFLVLPSTFAFYGISKTFIPLFLGEGYEKSITILMIMLPVVLFIGVSYCLGSLYYTPSGRRKKSTIYLIIGSSVNLVLNLSLIPFFGVYGACISTVISEALIAILYFINCPLISFKHFLNVIYKKVIAAVIMALIIYLFNYLKINALIITLIQVVTGFIIYLSLLLILKDDFTLTTTKHVLNIMKGKLHGRNR